MIKKISNLSTAIKFSPKTERRLAEIFTEKEDLKMVKEEMAKLPEGAVEGFFSLYDELSHELLDLERSNREESSRLTMEFFF